MQVVPPWALGLLCLSKRLHSIYMLRLFNDCVAMLLAYAATALLLERCWRGAALMYSAAVSVKMSVLLMAPPVLVVMLKVPVYGTRALHILSAGGQHYFSALREGCDLYGAA